MAAIDRIQHSVPMPEGVQASTSDSGYVEINGPKGSLNRPSNTKVEARAAMGYSSKLTHRGGRRRHWLVLGPLI